MSDIIAFLKRSWSASVVLASGTIILAGAVALFANAAVGIVPLAICAAVTSVWVAALYMFGARTQFTGAGYRYGRHTRIVAAITLCVLPLALLVVVLQPVLWTPSHLRIAIARFDDRGAGASGVEEKIREQLDDLSSRHRSLRFVMTKEVIAPEERGRKPMTVALLSRANIVVWGWYRKTDSDVLAAAAFTTMPSVNWVLLKSESSVQVPVSDLNQFRLQERIGRTVSALSLFALGVTRLEAGDPAEAADCFEELLSRRNDIPRDMLHHATVYYWLAQAKREIGDVDAALSALASAISSNPRHGRARVLRAEIYASRDDIEAAVRDLLATLGSSDGVSDAEALVKVGDLYAERQPDLALWYYRSAVRADPSYVVALKRQDELIRRTRRRTEARLL
jgi:hypothetical protein